MADELKEGFNPETHRMLDDGKSWVPKTYEGQLVGTSRKEIEKYNALVDRVVAANPGMTPQKAFDQIFEITQELRRSVSFLESEEVEEAGRKMVHNRQRISALVKLNLATEEQREELGKINAVFDGTVSDVVAVTGEAPALIRENIDSLLVSLVAEDISQAKEILINGPLVLGFTETNDPRIPNERVRQFLSETFGLPNIRRAMIGKITKDDQWLILTIERTNDIIGRGLAQGHTTAHSLVLAKSKDDYLEVEKLLEGVSSPDLLKHVYKVRATAGVKSGFHTIDIHSWGVEKSSDYDYLENCGLESEEDKMRACILGVIAHEVSHRYMGQLPKTALPEYQKIIDGETIPSRKKYVSDYVLRHAEVYGTAEPELLDEDLADSVKIYATNPRFLEQKFPERFAFIKKYLPFVKAGGVVDFARANN